MALLLLGIIVSRCSVEKNTGSTRAFHNLISRYNIYFNGKEAYNLDMEEVIFMLSQKEDKRIKMLVDRNGEHLRYEFQLKSLL